MASRYQSLSEFDVFEISRRMGSDSELPIQGSRGRHKIVEETPEPLATYRHYRGAP